jgi:stage II sporulation protein AA (anti-sigma F factor antagonist)
MTQVKIQEDGKTMLAMLSGEIDHHWAAVMRECIDERVRAALPKILVLDFSAVTFMDSSGIGLILGRHRLVHSLGGIVVVQKAPKDVQRMLSIAGIDAKE